MKLETRKTTLSRFFDIVGTFDKLTVFERDPSFSIGRLREIRLKFTPEKSPATTIFMIVDGDRCVLLEDYSSYLKAVQDFTKKFDVKELFFLELTELDLVVMEDCTLDEAENIYQLFKTK